MPRSAFFALVPFLLLAPAAHAQQAVMTVTGTIQLISDPASSLDATVTTGTPFTFTYIFDYVAPDPRDSDSGMNVYYFTAPGTGATMTFGDYVATPGGYVNDGTVGGDPSRYGIGLSTGGDNVTRAGMPVPGGAAPGIQLLTMNGVTYPGNALPPPSGFTLSDFKPYSDDVYGSAVIITGEFGPDDPGTFLKGRIDTLSVQAAPEPSAWIALSLGVVGLGMLVRRKRLV